MSAQAVSYPKDWALDVDEEGHRTYRVVWPVVTTDRLDGPDIALTAPGLALPGASLAIGNTTDPWAFYQRKGSAKLRKAETQRKLWDVTQIFSTLPLKRCSDDAIENPLLEPYNWRGGFKKTTKEATKDKDGNALLNSANQRFRGPAVQIPTSIPDVTLEMNVAWLDLDFLAEYVDSVNDSTWWNLAARKIKCSDFQWEQRLYGTCFTYFHVLFGFELNDDTWDLSLLDEGDMVKIAGTDPAEFKRAKDANEELVHVLLDGDGNALGAGEDEVYLTKRVLKEKDFSAVGWPATPLSV